jgi:hypothetical protein
LKHKITLCRLIEHEIEKKLIKTGILMKKNYLSFQTIDFIGNPLMKKEQVDRHIDTKHPWSHPTHKTYETTDHKNLEF